MRRKKPILCATKTYLCFVQILDVVLHFHFYRVAIIILTTFELLIPVLFRQAFFDRFYEYFS